MPEAVRTFFLEAWAIAGALAPWLFLGLGIAGLLHVLLPADFIRRHLGRPGWAAVVKAAAFGVPLPLCSCGVIPAAVGLKKDGASDGASVAFLISTPQTGVDSVTVSAAFLGWPFALFQVAAALVTGVVGGLLVDGWRPGAVRGVTGATENGMDGKTESGGSVAVPAAVREVTGATENGTDGKTESGGSVAVPAAVRGVTGATENGTAGVTGAGGSVAAPAVGLAERVREFWRFTAGELLGGIWFWLLIGVLVSALIGGVFPENSLADAKWAHGFSGMLVMLLLALPMYVCATASVPVAAALVSAGLPPGAALVFLMAGPASNAATIGAVWRTFGRRVTLVYLGVVVAASLGLGWCFGWLVAPVADPATAAKACCAAGHGGAASVWAGLLAAAFLAYAVRDLRRVLAGRKPKRPCCCGGGEKP